MIGPAVGQVIGTMIRGLLVSAPGVPPHVLLHAIAWQTGNMLASTIQADLSTLLSMRKSFKEAFHDGVTKAKIVPPPLPGPPANG